MSAVTRTQEFLTFVDYADTLFRNFPRDIGVSTAVRRFDEAHEALDSGVAVSPDDVRAAQLGVLNEYNRWEELHALRAAANKTRAGVQ